MVEHPDFRARSEAVLSAIFPVILCGGSGTRLWPSSRADRPKQFLKLIGKYSSFQETILRVMNLPGASEIVVVTGKAMAELVERQALELGAKLTVIIEPEARDSAPAVAAAAAYVRGLQPDGVMLMLAADHHIAEPELFREAALKATQAARSGLIVTFGVEPTGPATGFGYIKPGAQLSESVYAVAAFVEKPDAPTALRYVEEGYYWNSGNFAFSAKALLDELALFEPEIGEGAIAAVEGAERKGVRLLLDPKAFGRTTKKSLDYAVMERTTRAAVAPATFTWSDLGAWDAIWEASVRDSEGNAVSGDVHIIDSKGVMVRSNGPFVGVIGVEDLMIVAETDAVLVCRRDDAQAVKALVDMLKASGREIAHKHSASQAAGATRQCVSQGERHRVEIWRLEAGSSPVLPAGALQVLEGAIQAGDEVWSPGVCRQVSSDVTIRATSEATLSITVVESFPEADGAAAARIAAVAT